MTEPTDYEPSEADEARITELLADERLWDEPDPAEEDAIVAAIRAESASGDQTGPAEADSWSTETTEGTATVVPISRARRWFAPVAVGAAAMLAIVLAFGAISSDGDSEVAGVAVGLEGTELAPDASADATVSELAAGTRIVLAVRNLEPAGPGEYYEAWLRQDATIGVSAGTFHMRGGDDDIELWSGVSPDEYPLLTVTLQREGETESSGRVVLAGTVAD